MTALNYAALMNYQHQGRYALSFQGRYQCIGSFSFIFKPKTLDTFRGHHGRCCFECQTNKANLDFMFALSEGFDTESGKQGGLIGLFDVGCQKLKVGTWKIAIDLTRFCASVFLTTTIAHAL